MHPRVKFKMSPDKDISSFFNFLEERQYDNGRNFEWAVLKYHPYFNRFQNNLEFSVTKKEAQKYVFEFYLKNQKQIEKNFVLFEKKWRAKEKAFFALVEKIFPNTPWPKGKYIAYSTIWSMYPRFLQDKTFQIPGITRNKKAVVLIIAHELLHFIFFDYFMRKYKKYKSHKYDFFVWHVSEIFNSIILRQEEWQNLLESQNQDYPEHEKIISKLMKEKMSAEELIEKIVLDVQNSNL